MGLFDFVAAIGKKISMPGSGAQSAQLAEQIRKELETAQLGIQNLGVSVNGQICVLTGACADIAAYQKAVLIAGNIAGVSDVDAKGLTVASKPVDLSMDATEYYVIQKGDTLSHIAKRFYGNANEYHKVFEANREVIQDPDKIFPGQKIRIPKKD